MEDKNIVIEIGSEKVIVKLLWDKAPNICKKIWENLPLESSATLAKICNHEFMIQLPFNASSENLQPSVPGSVGWWPIRQNVNIWFGEPGPIGPLGPTALFGEVISNLKGLFKEGINAWVKPGIRVSIYKYIEKGKGEGINV